MDTCRGDITLALLADVLGPVEVIAIGPAGSPLPVTGHCSRCHSPATVYGPAGSPQWDRCRDGGAFATCQDRRAVLRCPAKPRGWG